MSNTFKITGLKNNKNITIYISRWKNCKVKYKTYNFFLCSCIDNWNELNIVCCLLFVSDPLNINQLEASVQKYFQYKPKDKYMDPKN